LKVVAHRYEVPGVRDDIKFMLLEVGNAGINFQVPVGGAVQQYRNGAGGAINCGNSPSVLGEPKSIAAGAAGKVEGFSWAELSSGFGQQRRWSSVEILGGAFSRAVALFPGADFHAGIVAGMAGMCKARPCTWKQQFETEQLTPSRRGVAVNLRIKIRRAKVRQAAWFA
jgi:hypothetical protein